MHLFYAEILNFSTGISLKGSGRPAAHPGFSRYTTVDSCSREILLAILYALKEFQPSFPHFLRSFWNRFLQQPSCLPTLFFQRFTWCLAFHFGDPCALWLISTRVLLFEDAVASSTSVGLRKISAGQIHEEKND